MEANYSIRFISPDQDAASCLKVYEPYVLYTPITFDCKVPELNEFQSKILDTIYEYPWLVCLKTIKSKAMHMPAVIGIKQPISGPQNPPFI